MASALERFRAAERAAVLLPAERSRNAASARASAQARSLGARPTAGGNFTTLTGGGGGGGDTPPPGTNSTAGVSTGTFQYSSVLPPLSPEMQRAFAERRRMATRQYEQAQQNVQRQRQQAEAAAVQQRRLIGREQAAQSRQGMTALAGRGVARSPMFVNPFQREVAQQAQQRVGELEMGLGQTLENLRLALQDAESARDRELQQIEFDILQARSNVPQLLGMM